MATDFGEIDMSFEIDDYDPFWEDYFSEPEEGE